jgi:hypothetical protein
MRVLGEWEVNLTPLVGSWCWTHIAIRERAFFAPPTKAQK